MANRDEISSYLDSRLEIGRVEDYSNNGLQIQGAKEVSRVALCVDAALSVYKRASERGCDMIVAHHGLIWGGLKSVTGREYEHVRFLIEHDMSLYAAHLPLDMHPEIGNNAVLARMAEMNVLSPFGKYHGADIGFAGTLPSPMTASDLASVWQRQIGGDPFILPFGPSEIRTVGIVSGRGGSSALGEAVDKCLDCFVSGEGVHEDHHLALEGKINAVYLGHYHSETVGVKAVGREIENRFDVEVTFIDEPTLL